MRAAGARTAAAAAATQLPLELLEPHVAAAEAFAAAAAFSVPLEPLEPLHLAEQHLLLQRLAAASAAGMHRRELVAASRAQAAMRKRHLEEAEAEQALAEAEARQVARDVADLQ